MKQSLAYFHIGEALGGSQDWLTDPMMRLGGCAAVCACDSCIWLARTRGLTGLYPYDAAKLSREDYIAFSRIMKPYLRPRWEGVHTTAIYTGGLGQYLADCGEERVTMTALPGAAPAAEAYAAVRRSIGDGLPVPCLILDHANPSFGDYEWHWFLLTGFDDESEGGPSVEAVTYGTARQLDFTGLWDTGKPRRGGLVFYHLTA